MNKYYTGTKCPNCEYTIKPTDPEMEEATVGSIFPNSLPHIRCPLCNECMGCYHIHPQDECNCEALYAKENMKVPPWVGKGCILHHHACNATAFAKKQREKEVSRFLKERHYQLVLPGIALADIEINKNQNYPHTLEQVIQVYLDRTGVSYTQQDVAEIQTKYLQKYGQLRPSQKAT